MFPMIRLLLLNRYDRLGASSRVRMLQYLPYLSGHGFDCHAEPLLGDDYLHAIYQKRKVSYGYLAQRYLHRLKALLAARRYDAVFIEKELLPNVPAWGERLLAASGIPYAVDYDDAIFHNYDMARNPLKRMLSSKIATVMRHAKLVIAGNSYLARHAEQAGASSVALLPTVIDLHSYAAKALPPRERLVIGWIGSPATVRNLEPVLPVLARLVKRFPLELAVIGGVIEDRRYPFVRHIAWKEESEAQEIAGFDIGIMPLTDAPWERGKCSYKLIQYMACGKPVVASPVGMNVDVVRDGINGFLASGADEWYEALALLLSDAEQRAEMGRRGRAIVEERYCMQVTAPKLAAMLRQVAGKEEAGICAA